MKTLPRTRCFPFSIATLLAFALCSAAWVGCKTTTSGPGGAQAEFQPFPAPAWELPDMDGNLVRSSEFAGKVVVLDFWATWCGPCVEEIPGFIKLQNQYGSDGLVIVGVNIGERADVVKDFMSETGMNYRVVAGNEDLEAAVGGVPAIPATFIINREGTVVGKHEGLTPMATFESEIQPLL